MTETKKSGATGEVVARQIHQMIQSRELRPGDPLRERMLAEQFGISRGPVREALRSLAARGVVSLEPNKGARVSRPSDKDVLDLVDVSGAMMKLVGRKAAEQAREDSFPEILAHAEALVKAAPTDIEPRKFVRMQGMILVAIVESFDSPRIMQLVQDYIFAGPGAFLIIWSLTTPAQRKRSADRWMKGVQAIVAREPQKAEKAFERIHKAGQDAVMTLVGSGGADF